MGVDVDICLFWISPIYGVVNVSVQILCSVGFGLMLKAEGSLNYES